MLYEIDFNRKNIGTDEHLIKLGAIWNDEKDRYMIEMITAEDFLQLALDIEEVFKSHRYTYIVGADTPQEGYIFIDKDI